MEVYSYDVDIPKIIQSILYAAILQEVIHFGSPLSLVAHDLSLGNFRWESFEICLDVNRD